MNAARQQEAHRSSIVHHNSLLIGAPHCELTQLHHLGPVFSSATSISHSSHWNQTWHSIFVEMNSILELNSWCGQPRHPLTPISSALRKQPGTPPIHIDPAVEPTIVLPCTHVRPKYFSNGNFQFDSRTLPTHIAINQLLPNVEPFFQHA